MAFGFKRIPIPSPEKAMPSSSNVSTSYVDYMAKRKALENRKSMLEKKIRDLDSNINDIKSRLQTAKTDAAVAKSALKIIAADQKTLNNKLAALMRQRDSIMGDKQGKLEELKRNPPKINSPGDLARYKKRIADLEAASRAGTGSSIETSISSLERQMSTNRTKIEQYERQQVQGERDQPIYAAKLAEQQTARDGFEQTLREIESELAKLPEGRSGFLNAEASSRLTERSKSSSGSSSKISLPFKKKPNLLHSAIGWVYNYHPSNELYHSGKKGMRWGYNDGRRNGGRVADPQEEAYNRLLSAQAELAAAKADPNSLYNRRRNYNNSLAARKANSTVANNSGTLNSLGLQPRSKAEYTRTNEILNNARMENLSYRNGTHPSQQVQVPHGFRSMEEFDRMRQNTATTAEGIKALNAAKKRDSEHAAYIDDLRNKEAELNREIALKKGRENYSKTSDVLRDKTGYNAYTDVPKGFHSREEFEQMKKNTAQTDMNNRVNRAEKKRMDAVYALEEERRNQAAELNRTVGLREGRANYSKTQNPYKDSGADPYDYSALRDLENQRKAEELRSTSGTKNGAGRGESNSTGIQSMKDRLSESQYATAMTDTQNGLKKNTARKTALENVLVRANAELKRLGNSPQDIGRRTALQNQINSATKELQDVEKNIKKYANDYKRLRNM